MNALVSSDFFDYYLQNSLCQNRTNAVSDLTEAVPFGFIENKPVRETL
jgi:hypothetical protein